MKFTLVHSNVTGATQHEVARWILTPNCRRGPCTTRLESVTGDYTLRVAFIKGRYQWTRKDSVGYVCGEGASAVDIPSIEAYSLRPSAMRLVNDSWVVTRFAGVNDAKGLTSGGCFELADERFVFKGVLKG